MAPRSVLEIDLGAIRHNVGVLADLARDAVLCVVVKADGYGHGAVDTARAALEAGAGWLAVSQVAEAVPLRRAGIDAPLLLLSEPLPHELDDALDLGCRIVVYRPDTIVAIDDLVVERGLPSVKLHLKVDTGMQRVGCPPDEAVALAELISDRRAVELEGLMTHLAVADEPDNPETAAQLDRFERVEAAVREAGFAPSLVHAANSAGLIDHPRARRDLARIGIAAYGVPPAPGIGNDLGLRAAMSFRSQVTLVKPVRAGTAVSYGLKHTFDADTRVATVPVGYADGVPRALGLAGADVLIGGRRHPIVGVVTMDQLMVDVGADSDVAIGDPVTLIGADGAEAVTAEEWGERTGTIGYEIVCNVGRRATRIAVGDGS